VPEKFRIAKISQPRIGESLGVDALRSIEFIGKTAFGGTFNATGFNTLSINTGSVVGVNAGTFNQFE
jgi:hypothetical protein